MLTDRPPLFTRLLHLVCYLITVSALGNCHAAEPTTAPQLRLEAGMHTAIIKRIATDASGRYAVTASDDKTARVWEVATGKLLQVLRPPIDAGNEGKLYAVALSPDGQTVAVGGWTGGDWNRQVQVYLFERSTGRLQQRLTGLPNVINHLDFSPDGRWLAATLGGNNGIRVWDTHNWGSPLADSDYGATSYGASFSRDGQLATTAYDGQIRRYTLAAGRLQLLQKSPATGGRQPHGIAFSPDGQHLAVCYADSAQVEVLEARTLVLRFRPDTRGVDNGDLGGVTWRADGQALWAGGTWDKNGFRPIRQWAAGGQGAAQDILLATNSVMSLAPLPIPLYTSQLKSS